MRIKNEELEILHNKVLGVTIIERNASENV